MHNTQGSTISMISRDEGIHKGGLSNLRTPGLLGRYPFIGLVMILLGCAVFGVIVVNLQTNGPLIQTDLSVANSVHTAALQSSPFTRDIMISGFYLGEQVIGAIGALLAVYFLIRRFWPEFWMVGIAWIGEVGIWFFLSQYYGRPRPIFDVAVWHQMTSPGFPSGHSISAVMCYGLIAYLLAPKIRSHIWKAVCILTALLMILFIGYSRIFVGDHYLSDVLAGYALGIAWSGLVFTSIEYIFKKRMHRYV
jgi:membrane-associated phospholipid phosphatase